MHELNKSSDVIEYLRQLRPAAEHKNMAWKNTDQRSLADALVTHHPALTELDDVHALIDWARIEKLLSGIHAKKKGEQAWPPLLMFKALLLQSW